MRLLVLAGLIGILAPTLVCPAYAGSDAPGISLEGSEESMLRQNRVARRLGLPFVRTPSEFPRLLGEGSLVALSGNADYEVLNRVPHPYARPEVRIFIEQLAAEYREATGEKLVVTSLTRPTTRQPKNAHHLSVHPAGIAIDLRISSKRRSSQWLERRLLEMETDGVLDVTRERRPPHFHVALFPDVFVTRDEGTRVERSRVEGSRVEGSMYVGTWDVGTWDEERTEATLLGSLTDGDRDWLPLVVSLPLIGLVVGAFGFRRKTRVVPTYPHYIPPPPPVLERDPWRPRVNSPRMYPPSSPPPQWQRLDQWSPSYYGDGSPYPGGREFANRTARSTPADNTSAVWHS